MKLFSFLLTLLFLTSCSEKVEQKPTTPLTISTSNGEIRFNVEVAQTPEELQKGLMYRTQMPLNNGMIFSIVAFIALSVAIYYRLRTVKS